MGWRYGGGAGDTVGKVQDTGSWGIGLRAQGTGLRANGIGRKAKGPGVRVLGQNISHRALRGHRG